MNKEQLLKSISNLLKKHEDYLNSNPEVFYAIEDRLIKAIDYEDWEGEEDQDQTNEDEYGDDENGYGDDLFDRVSSEDDQEEFQDSNEDNELDEADRWLQDNDQEREGTEEDSSNIAETGSVQQPEEELDYNPSDEDKGPDKPKNTSSRYREWQPKGDYKPEHKGLIDNYMKEGYSHREAERMAGAHDSPNDFYSALRHTVNPSEPSPKMLEQMKELSHGWLKNADKVAMQHAEAEKNPIKYATGKSIKAHEEAHGDFSDAYNNFMNSNDVKGLKGRERHQAIQSWKKQYQEQNPEHREKAIAAADAGKHFEQANEARKQRREEGTQAILDAGKKNIGGFGEGYSEAVSQAGGGEMSDQAAAQMVGGVKSESGYQTNIQKDPAAVFAERNPEYIKSLKQKISTKLDPQQMKRMSAIDSVKKIGSE